MNLLDDVFCRSQASAGGRSFKRLVVTDWKALWSAAAAQLDVTDRVRVQFA